MVEISPSGGSGSQLSTGFKQRHVSMISIAGIIGAGLFVASGHAIASAGPATILAYASTGVLVIMIMRMLGEMAVASPDTGSFSTYAERAIGPWAGFTIGWLYWWFWVLLIPWEALAGGAILNSYVPSIPIWQFAFGMTALLTLTNLLSVGKYGEFEFWFAMIKVVAILAFIAFGFCAIMGLIPGFHAAGVVALTARHGGFMPNGFGAVVGALLTTMFSFIGTEAVTIAAAESANPEKQIASATRSVIWRICIFYLGSILIVISVVPWNDPLLPTHGAYQRTLEVLGIGNAKLLIDGVIVASVASCLNSAIYISSRMLFSLSHRGDAPKRVGRTSGGGVPRAAVIASTLVGLATTAINFLAPASVFNFLIATSGAIALLVYLVIAVSQLRGRRALLRRGGPIVCRMWFYPYLTWATILFICGALITMAFLPEHRGEIAATGTLTLAIIIIGIVRQHRAVVPAAAKPLPVV
ncbi:amino acid permease [Novosphingobium rosa]|uniref:amino acid permease n=1 Tax=Novosphingobium rosa TaxID=76978 RepID=UPI000835B508|nr:amino acid permease [Novosphingobium rosa]